MTRQALIEKAIQTINHLPTEKIKEISSYAEFILKQQEEKYLSKNIIKLNILSTSFDFLNEEEEIYTTADLKTLLNEER
ncbi:MAG: hypothetical protein IPQ19_03365 [Bacteroidetes bacterium]|nr:hypothetical protein [Bacteroidota bacterium]